MLQTVKLELMNTSQIPEDAVQAAAQVVPYEAVVEASRAIDDDAYVLLGWEGITRLLEAAAPFIRAQSLRDAVDAFPLETITAPDNAVVWLRRRAQEVSPRG